MAKIDITARLNAASVDGILASANQIYDENKGKFQEQVNQEVENALEETITSEDTGMVVESIEEGIIHNALRKTEQILTEAEKGQARENIGAVSEQTFENEAVRVKKQVFTSEQKYQARHNISAITAEEAEKIAQDKINESAVSSPDKLQAVKELSSWLEDNPESAATMNAAIQENAADIQRLYRGTGLDEYSEFSTGMDYAAGDVVLYDGVLFRFKADHAKGEWDYNEVEEWSEKKERESVVVELGSEIKKNKSDLFAATSKSMIEVSFDLKSKSKTNNQVTDYLGKNWQIYLTGESPKRFQLYARNITTGNEISIYDSMSSDVDFPLLIKNTRPDLELIDLHIVYSSIAVDNAKFKLSISKQSDIAKNTSDIAKNTSDIAKNTSDIKENRGAIFGLTSKETVEVSFDLTSKANTGELVMNYLGKEWELNLSGESPKRFNLEATNVATGNTITIYNGQDTDVDFPLTVENPRPDLELINLTIRYFSTSVGNAEFTLVASKSSNIAKNTSDIEKNRKKAEESAAKAFLFDKVGQEAVFSQSYHEDTRYEYNVLVGKTPFLGTIKIPKGVLFKVDLYNIETGTGFNCIDINTKEQAIHNTYEFTNPRLDLYLHKLTVTIYSGVGSGNFEVSLKRTDTPIYQQLIELNNYAKTGMLPHYYWEMQASAGVVMKKDLDFHSGISYQFNVDAPKTNLVEIRLYEQANSTGNHKVILSATPSKKITFNYTPRKNYRSIQVYYGGNTEQGTAYIDINTYNGRRIDKCKRQFGLFVKDVYETPQQPALQLPSDILSYFYGLFDELQSRYPDYITKEDCDKIAINYGHTRPEYLKDLPIYMYRFIPPYTPESSSMDVKKTNLTKSSVMIVGGTHPEYMGIYDLYLTMAEICNHWDASEDLQALRWESEFYVIPCSSPWGVKNGSRVNYNGVDPNRNMPTSDWVLMPEGKTYSGAEPGSEYESKVLQLLIDGIRPDIFIDHHNTNIGYPKVLMYISSQENAGIDVAAYHIQDMSVRWKKRFTEIFSKDNEIYGFALRTEDPGTRSTYASDRGCFSFTYESQASLAWSNGVCDGVNRLHTSDAVTLAVDGFIHFLVRVLSIYSELN